MSDIKLFRFYMFICSTQGGIDSQRMSTDFYRHVFGMFIQHQFERRYSNLTDGVSKMLPFEKKYSFFFED